MLSISKILEKIQDNRLLVEGLDYDVNQLDDGYVVVKLNDSEMYNEKYGPARARIFNRAEAVFHGKTEKRLLLAPTNEKIETINFITEKNAIVVKIRHRDGKAQYHTESAPPFGQLTIKNVNVYPRDRSQINPEQRIDAFFYNDQNVEFTTRLNSYPTLEKVTEYIRCGYHTNFKKSIASDLGELAYGLGLEKSSDGYYPISILGVENMSPYGSVRGRASTIELKNKPKTPPATKGDIIMCLLGTRGSKDTLGATAIIEANREYYVNQTFAVLKPIAGIDSYFLLHTLSSDYFKRQLRLYSKPVGPYQSMVSLSDLRKMRVIMYDPEKRAELAEKRRGWMDAIKHIEKEMADHKIDI